MSYDWPYIYGHRMTWKLFHPHGSKLAPSLHSPLPKVAYSWISLWNTKERWRQHAIYHLPFLFQDRILKSSSNFVNSTCSCSIFIMSCWKMFQHDVQNEGSFLHSIPFFLSLLGLTSWINYSKFCAQQTSHRGLWNLEYTSNRSWPL